MKYEPENELLSAYLDDELTAAERVEVEQLLASDPAARQLMEELRAVSSTLQSLPQEKVGEDLGPRVLRAAERRMLTEDRPDDQRPAVTSGQAIWRRVLTTRGLVWSGLAVAVAVIFMLSDRAQNRHPPLEVAKRPPAATSEATNEKDLKPRPAPSMHAREAGPPAGRGPLPICRRSP